MADQLLSDRELALWHAWTQASDAVSSRVTRELQLRADLSSADFEVLSRLVDLGNGELRQHELAKSMKWAKSRLSHHLTRMESRDLLERRNIEAQAVHVRISRLGRTTLKAARAVHAAAVREFLLGAIAAKERPKLSALLERLAEPE